MCLTLAVRIDSHTDVLLYWPCAGQSKSWVVYAELCHVVLNLDCQLGQQYLPEHSGQMSTSAARVPQDCKHNLFAVQIKKMLASRLFWYWATSRDEMKVVGRRVWVALLCYYILSRLKGSTSDAHSAALLTHLPWCWVQLTEAVHTCWVKPIQK